MKHSALKAIASLLLLTTLTTGLLSARTQSAERIVVTIPFQFDVHGKSFPAGEYDVTRVSVAGSGLLVRSRDCKKTVILLTQGILSDSDKQARLVFNSYGNRRYLSQIWLPGETTGRYVPPSGAERKLKRELAMNAENRPQQITLLARRG